MKQIHWNSIRKNDPGHSESWQNQVIIIAMILMIMFISQFFFFRIDLTSEKRYTLSPVTKETLEKMPDMVFVKVYLDGDLPLGFKKMRNDIREMLDEFRAYAGDKLQYQFINPLASNDPAVRKKMIEELYNKGLAVTNVQAEDEEGGRSEKYIFPGAILSYHNAEVALNLLQNNPGLSSEDNLNNSEQLLEYRFISTLHTITSDSIKKVAFIEGHGEFDQYQTADITKELANFFQVDRGTIGGMAGSLDQYEAVIIAGPTQRFPEADKFVLDQYLMKGGKILWFLDAVNASMDSLKGENTVATINDMNLDDQLFRYGVRINPNLIEDVQCSLIPVNAAIAGQPARFVPAPWLYYPLLNPASDHPASRNINLVKSEFASSIDTLAVPGIKKTVLLATSPLTRLVNAPVIISIEQIRHTPDQQDFNKSRQPVAILLEGKFPSVFKNRMLNDLGIKGSFKLMTESRSTAMLVVGDAGIIRNDVRVTPQGPLLSPVGYDRYSRQTFGNRDFIVNTINYLTDASGIIQLRNKEFRLRLLNAEKIHSERLYWQLINTVLPVLLIIAAGLGAYFFRKRKYGLHE